MKDGLNYVAMAYILDFFDQIVDRWGRSAVYWTGDGGGKALPDLRPVRRVPDLEAAVKEFAASEALVPASLVERALGLVAGDLTRSLKERLLEYPENDFTQKFLHFRIYERWRSWTFEGEDRNRFFLWSTSPFFGLAFLDGAMKVPDRLKSGHKLYRAFQKELSPHLISIPHADVGQPIGTLRYRLRSTASRRLPAGLKRLIRKIARKSSDRSEPSPLGMATSVQGTLRESSRLAQLFDADATNLALLHASPTRVIRCWETLTLLDRVWTEKLPLDLLTAEDGRL